MKRGFFFVLVTFSHYHEHCSCMEKALGKLEDAQKENIKGNARTEVPALIRLIFDTIYNGLRNYLWAKEIYITF